MLRCSLISLLLCVCLLFAGCAGDMSLENPTTPTAQPTSLPRPIGALSDSMGLILNTSFSSYEEYLEFIGTSTLPECFTTYNQLSHWGNFKSFTCNLIRETGVYSNNNHYYSVIDHTGLLFTIGILPGKDEPLVHSVSATPNLSDMRRLNSNETGLYRYGDVYYHYINGEIYCIKWEIDGVQFYVRPHYFWMEIEYYPYVETTVFGKLMNIQNRTTEEVLQLVLNG